MHLRMVGLAVVVLSIIGLIAFGIYNAYIYNLSTSWVGIVGGLVVGLLYCKYMEDRWPKSAGDVYISNEAIPKGDNITFPVNIAIVLILSLYALLSGVSLKMMLASISIGVFIIMIPYLIFKNSING